MKTLTLQEYIHVFQQHNIYVSSNIIDDSLAVAHITYDSRTVIPGTLFVCKGAHFKAEYAVSALQNGAIALVCETVPNMEAAYVQVSDIRKAISIMADLFYDGVQHQICSIGLTGTKGKSTTAQYIRDCLNVYFIDNQKPKCAIISSIDTYDGVIDKKSHITTPEPFELYASFQNAVQSGISHLVMEVSSQALKYGRVSGLHYNVAAFTNIGLDHISPIEHSSFEDYLESKLKIFDMSDVAVINTDSDHFDVIYKRATEKCKVITYGTSETADIRYFNVENREDGIYFEVMGHDFKEKMSITMPGLFNVSNAVCAVAILHHLKIPMDYIVKGLRHSSVDGRMQLYSSKDNRIKVIVDYAHNKLSFDTLYESVRKEYPGKKIVTVFGCPGNKALLRRHDMGVSANENSDYIYITEDDPAEETFEAIAAEIEQYITDCPYKKVANRSMAIKQAILNDCNQEKIVLLLGKGQEKTQKRGTILEEYLSDAVYAKQYLEKYDLK